MKPRAPNRASAPRSAIRTRSSIFPLDLGPSDTLDVSFAINGCPLGSVTDAIPTRQLRPQFSEAETYEYSFEVPPECLVYPTGPVDVAAPVEIEQNVEITNDSGSDIRFDYVGLSPGSIAEPTPVPETGALAMGAAALGVLAALRRRRW